LHRTGQPPSAYPRTPPRFRYDTVALLPDMDALAPRIAARTGAMFRAGLVAEVERLLARYPRPETARQAIGYKEVIRHLKGDLTLLEAEAAVNLATTQYAKRQRTFFRKEAQRYNALAHEVADELASWLTKCVGELA
jgi:tRNA dimethylallyltransferase